MHTNRSVHNRALTNGGGAQPSGFAIFEIRKQLDLSQGDLKQKQQNWIGEKEFKINKSHDAFLSLRHQLSDSIGDCLVLWLNNNNNNKERWKMQVNGKEISPSN